MVRSLLLGAFLMAFGDVWAKEIVGGTRRLLDRRGNPCDPSLFTGLYACCYTQWHSYYSGPHQRQRDYSYVCKNMPNSTVCDDSILPEETSAGSDEYRYWDPYACTREIDAFTGFALSVGVERQEAAGLILQLARLAKLEEEKAVAVSVEDYDLAKQLKTSIEALESSMPMDAASILSPLGFGQESQKALLDVVIAGYAAATGVNKSFVAVVEGPTYTELEHVGTMNVTLRFVSAVDAEGIRKRLADPSDLQSNITAAMQEAGADIGGLKASFVSVSAHHLEQHTTLVSGVRRFSNHVLDPAVCLIMLYVAAAQLCLN